MVVGGWFMNNKLRLPAGALERHHRGPRNFGCRLGAEVASHEVKTEIEACRRAGRGQYSSVVDIEHVGIDIDRRVAARQLRRAAPVGRCPQAIKRPCCGQNERATANRGDAGARDRPLGESRAAELSGIDWSRSAMPGTITVSARLNDESRHGTLNVTCSDFTSGATLQIRTSYNGTSVAPANQSEYLAWRRQVTEHDAVECHDGDQMARPSRDVPDWLKSFEHCLFSHWR